MSGCPWQPPACQHLAASTRQGARAPSGQRSKSQNWSWMERAPSLELQEGGETRGRVQSPNAEVTLAAGEAADTWDSVFSSRGWLSRAEGQRLFLCPGTQGRPQDRATLDRVDTGRGGRDGAFLCTMPGPSLTCSTTPPPLSSQSSFMVTGEAPAPKVFTGAWQGVSDPSRWLLPKQPSLEGWISVAGTVAESRSDCFCVPLCLGEKDARWLK